jgi:hypothetical protein
MWGPTASPNRIDFLNALEEELLEGGVIIPESTTLICQQANEAFVSGVPLATLLTAVAAIEAYLRGESFASSREPLYSLINHAMLEEDLREDLHKLRKYRNRWVHFEDRWDDQHIATNSEATEEELDAMSFFAVRAMLRTLYSVQWI